jgi:hypothetical protein
MQHVNSVLASLQELIDKEGQGKLKKVNSEFSWEELMHDTDRGCLLATAAFLDDILEDRIRGKLHNLSGIGKDDLNFLLTRRPLPPLGSFGVRIVTARALGIIDGNIRSALTSIQDIRNANAHSWRGFKLTDKHVKAITKHFDATRRKLVDEGAAAFDLFIEKKHGVLAGILARPSRERLAFILACTTLVAAISPEED